MPPEEDKMELPARLSGGVGAKEEADAVEASVRDNARADDAEEWGDILDCGGGVDEVYLSSCRTRDCLACTSALAEASSNSQGK